MVIGAMLPMMSINVSTVPSGGQTEGTIDQSSTESGLESLPIIILVMDLGAGQDRTSNAERSKL